MEHVLANQGVSTGIRLENVFDVHPKSQFAEHGHCIQVRPGSVLAFWETFYLHGTGGHSVILGVTSRMIIIHDQSVSMYCTVSLSQVILCKRTSRSLPCGVHHMVEMINDMRRHFLGTPMFDLVGVALRL